MKISKPQMERCGTVIQTDDFVQFVHQGRFRFGQIADLHVRDGLRYMMLECPTNTFKLFPVDGMTHVVNRTQH